MLGAGAAAAAPLGGSPRAGERWAPTVDTLSGWSGLPNRLIGVFAGAHPCI